MTDEKLMARRFIDAALELIDQKNGLTDVDLREVSRSLGCAHTNLYNYYKDFADLLWYSLIEAIERLTAYTRSEMAKAKDRKSAFRVFIGSQIDFARAHPGWYRFIWLEPIQGAPPEHLIPKMVRPQEEFMQLLIEMLPSPLKSADARKVSEIIHGYLHGNLSRLVTGRFALGEPPDFRKTLIENTLLIYRMFSKQAVKTGRGKASL